MSSPSLTQRPIQDQISPSSSTTSHVEITACRLVVVLACVFALSSCDDAVVGTDVKTPEVSPHFATGWIVGPHGESVEITYEVIEGRAIFEGDIDLGPVALIAKSRLALEKLERSKDVQEGLVLDGSQYHWPGATVPYVVSGVNQTKVSQAMNMITARTRIAFVPRTSQANYISIQATTNPDICGQSPVGMRGGVNTVLFNDQCAAGSLAHELLHSLGMWHEQSRCDRNNHVTILTQNIVSGYESQFDRYCTTDSNGDYVSDVGFYGLNSIMHYWQYAFSRQPHVLPTIQANNGQHNLMGQRDSLAQADIKGLGRMYPYPLNISGPQMIHYSGPYSWTVSGGGPNTPITYSWRMYLSGQGEPIYVGSSMDLDVCELGWGVFWLEVISDDAFGYTGRGMIPVEVYPFEPC